MSLNHLKPFINHFWFKPLYFQAFRGFWRLRFPAPSPSAKSVKTGSKEHPQRHQRNAKTLVPQQVSSPDGPEGAILPPDRRPWLRRGSPGHAAHQLRLHPRRTPLPHYETHRLRKRWGTGGLGLNLTSLTSNLQHFLMSSEPYSLEHLDKGCSFLISFSKQLPYIFHTRSHHLSN